ncbi:MAG: amidohydrolase family protein [Planctomycetes bacterium]|nr:amidohydrolase family protein [Planctomycetota bacterium]
MKTTRSRRRAFCAACAVVLGALAASSLQTAAAQQMQGKQAVVAAPRAPLAGEKGGPGLALLARKVLAVPLDGQQVVDNAVVLVKDGKIEAVGPARSTPIPAGYEVQDVGDKWLMPGMIDLHTHIGGTYDINDMVYLVNPGLRVSTSVIPKNEALKRDLASGVTTVLFIPGSGVNMSGQGVLIKTGHERYEDALVRAPGSLKIAQAGNPEGWVMGIGRSFMNWDTREMLKRGQAYAKRWEAFEKGTGPRPERLFDLDVFPDLFNDGPDGHKRTQVSTHTQMFQVVLMTITMLKGEFGLDAYIDHGSLGGYRAAELALKMGVPAILGPREIEIPTRQIIGWTNSDPDAIRGMGAEYQKRGMRMIGFNTDAPVIPAEELQLQAGMAGRYGMDFSNLEGVRGLTIVPATTAGIQKRVGSIEPGKDADIVVISGDPADPRKWVEKVLSDGKWVYDSTKERRLW